MEIKTVYIVSNNPNNFRFNIPGEIIGVVWCRPDDVKGKYPERLCYMIRWDDGVVDYQPVKGEYLFMDEWQKAKFLQDKREADMLRDPAGAEFQQKAETTLKEFVDALSEPPYSPDSPIRTGMFVISSSGFIRFVTAMGPNGNLFVDDGRISGAAPSPMCHVEFYRPATAGEISDWMLKKLKTEKKNES